MFSVGWRVAASCQPAAPNTASKVLTVGLPLGLRTRAPVAAPNQDRQGDQHLRHRRGRERRPQLHQPDVEPHDAGTRHSDGDPGRDAAGHRVAVRPCEREAVVAGEAAGAGGRSRVTNPITRSARKRCVWSSVMPMPLPPFWFITNWGWPSEKSH